MGKTRFMEILETNLASIKLAVFILMVLQNKLKKNNYDITFHLCKWHGFRR